MRAAKGCEVSRGGEGARSGARALLVDAATPTGTMIARVAACSMRPRANVGLCRRARGLATYSVDAMRNVGIIAHIGEPATITHAQFSP